MLAGQLQGLLDPDNADLLAGRADQSDLRNPDPLIDARFSADVSSKVSGEDRYNRKGPRGRRSLKLSRLQTQPPNHYRPDQVNPGCGWEVRPPLFADPACWPDQSTRV